MSSPLAAREKAPSLPESQPLTLERIFSSPDLSGSQPRALKISPDGAQVTLLKNRKNDRDRYDLWGIDTRTGKEAMLVDSLKVGSGAELSEAEKMQRERARIGGTRGIVSCLEEKGRAKDIVLIAHDLSDTNRKALIRGTIDAVINQEPGHEVRSAVRVLMSKADNVPLIESQERIRIDIFLRDNLP